MSHRKHRLTLGDLIHAIAQYAHNQREMNLVVADLTSRGIVKNTKHHKRFKVVMTC